MIARHVNLDIKRWILQEHSVPSWKRNYFWPRGLCWLGTQDFILDLWNLHSAHAQGNVQIYLVFIIKWRALPAPVLYNSPHTPLGVLGQVFEYHLNNDDRGSKLLLFRTTSIRSPCSKAAWVWAHRVSRFSMYSALQILKNTLSFKLRLEFLIKGNWEQWQQHYKEKARCAISTLYWGICEKSKVRSFESSAPQSFPIAPSVYLV